MTQERWTEVDRYLAESLVRADPSLDAAIKASRASGLPSWDVSPTQGKLLYLIARLGGARSILEIGTLGGYSTIWLAKALPPGGQLISLEVEPKYAEVARSNVCHAGFSDMVEVRVGAALDTLPALANDGQRPFDVVFIDADKENIPRYFEWAITLSRVGSVIVVDNVIRDGKVMDAATTDPSVQGVRRLNELISADHRVSATAIQTVGVKGYDGFAIALVTSR